MSHNSTFSDDFSELILTLSLKLFNHQKRNQSSSICNIMLCHKTCEMKKLQMNVAHTIQNTQKFKFVSTRASDNSFGPMDFLEGHFQLAVVSGPDRPEAR